MPFPLSLKPKKIEGPWGQWKTEIKAQDADKKKNKGPSMPAKKIPATSRELPKKDSPWVDKGKNIGIFGQWRSNKGSSKRSDPDKDSE